MLRPSQTYLGLSSLGAGVGTNSSVLAALNSKIQVKQKGTNIGIRSEKCLLGGGRSGEGLV